jgi:hypothetical protein
MVKVVVGALLGLVVTCGAILGLWWGLGLAVGWAKPEPPSAGLSDIRVRVFEAEPAEVPLDMAGKLHVFCNARRGHLIYVYEGTLVVVKGGCVK